MSHSYEGKKVRILEHDLPKIKVSIRLAAFEAAAFSEQFYVNKNRKFPISSEMQVYGGRIFSGLSLV